MSNLLVKQLPSRMYQRCPLCGEKQVIQIHGLAADLETGAMKMCADMGYSFCNCRNIFFTDWKNITPAVYDEWYYQKYQTDDIKNIAQGEFKKFYLLINHLGYDPTSIIEIGSVTDHILDLAKEEGLDTTGLDIFDHASNHEKILGSFEEISDFPKKYDLIWASHVFEHFKDPSKALLKCKDLLSERGILYIAMPDTFFIDFENPENTMNWDWGVREHHTLWCMESWIKFCEEHGFKLLHSERNIDLYPQKKGDWFWKKDFKVLLCANQ